MNLAEAMGIMAKIESDSGTFEVVHSAELSEAEAIRRFVLAGNATFTIESRKTGARYTYRARTADGKPTFVSLLTGASNETDYEFLGTIFPEGSAYRHGRRSRIGADAPGARAFAWFWERLASHAPTTCAFYHSGRCGRCGRRLTVPQSIQTGLGPECAAKS